MLLLWIAIIGWTSIYACSYGVWLYRIGNGPGAYGVFLLVFLTMLLQFCLHNAWL